MSYEQYFKIDSTFHPIVDEEAARRNPELWKTYYPHETFVSMVKRAVQMLDGSLGGNLWVHGAYGTGKSHAVLTLRCLLSAPVPEVKEYFDRYSAELPQDLYRQLLSVKQHEKILSVHRSGSSDMDSRALLFAVRDSIESALKEAGYVADDMESMKDAVLNYLRQDDARKHMELALQQCVDLFPGETVDSLIQRLQSYEGAALITDLRKLDKLAKRCRLAIFELDHESLRKWIVEVVAKNQLSSIVFFWDEFSEFFANNRGNLTGFQELAQLSITGQFHFVIVTHAAEDKFSKGSESGNKLADRFHQCSIDLPENMAFRLLGNAMKVTDDAVLRKKWNELVLPSLVIKTPEARAFVQQKAHIREQDLNAILPIHPYAALVLKHIAKTYASNQRSMFDFICSQDMEAQGFRWFIREVDPYRQCDFPLLTLDRLWKFFYEKGKHHLSSTVRDVLATYDRHQSQLNSSEEMVLKVILLLEALSRNVAEVDCLTPSQSNIRCALQGTMLENNFPTILSSLVRKNILWEQSLRGSEKRYLAAQSIQDRTALEAKKKQVNERPTDYFFNSDVSDLRSTFTWPADLKNRYSIDYASAENFNTQLNAANRQAKEGKLGALICIARTTNEQVTLRQKIREAVTHDTQVVLVDATYTLPDPDTWANYVETQAQGLLHHNGDRNQANSFLSEAKNIINKWMRAITQGRFSVYSYKRQEGVEAQGATALSEQLRLRIVDFYPEALELWGYRVSDTMWTSNAAAMMKGVKCGVTGTTEGTFRAAQAGQRPENFMQAAWTDESFFRQQPAARISRLTKKVRAYVEKKLKDLGGISMRELLVYLRKSEYGILSCNLSAFILGFILRPYAQATYQCSDNITTAPMSAEMLGQMIKDAMLNTGRDKQLRAMSDEVRAFVKASAEVFAFDPSRCATIDLSRDLIQTSMKGNRFPIWVLETLSPVEEVRELIHLYVGIVNSANYGDGSMTDSDIANRIGTLCMKHPETAHALKSLMQRMDDGMMRYLSEYRDGALPGYAETIGDDGAYLERLAEKFDSQDSLWVWNKETAQNKIDELITEYAIVIATNQSLDCRALSYTDAMSQWFEKCNALAISHAAAEHHWGKLSAFMAALHEGFQRKTSLRRKDYKENILKLVNEFGRGFRELCAEPLYVFASVCRTELEGLDDQDIKAVYNTLPMDGTFAQAKTSYISMVKEAVASYKETRGISKLRAWWLERTGSTSPRAWSQSHRTPILCLVPTEELKQASEAMAVLEASHPERAKLELAESYLSGASFFTAMEDAALCDVAFVRSLCSTAFAPLLDPHVAELRQALVSQLGEDAFDWYPSNPKAVQVAESVAKTVYCADGHKDVVSLLESLSPEELHRQLLAAVSTDMNLGLALLNYHAAER